MEKKKKDKEQLLKKDTFLWMDESLELTMDTELCEQAKTLYVEEKAMWHVNHVTWATNKLKCDLCTYHTYVYHVYTLETTVINFLQLEKVNRTYLEWLVAINQTFVWLSKYPLT